MSTTTGTFPGVRIVDMPDLGSVTDSSSMVGERAGSGRFGAPAFRSYVSTITATGSTTPRLLADRFAETKNVKDFGAVGNGTTDDTAAIQATINAAGALVLANGAAGCDVRLPAGTYRVTAGLTCPFHGVTLRGSGRHSTIILAAFTSGDVFTVGDGSTTQWQGCGIFDIGWYATANRTSGAAIRLRNALQLTIERISILPLGGGNHYDGISFESTSNGCFEDQLSDFEIRGLMNNGIRVGDVGTGGGAVNAIGDIFINRGYIEACYNGILICNSASFSIQQVDIFRCVNTGVCFYPVFASNQSVTFGLVSNVWADSTTAGHAWSFLGDGYMADIFLTNCWGSSASGHGFFFTGARGNGLRLSNCVAASNQQAGYQLTAGTNISLIGCTAETNSVVGVSTTHGVNIQPGVSGFQITGCFSGAGGFQSANGVANKQGYGIIVQSGASDHYLISNNRCPGNQIGGVADGGTGTNKLVVNNLAF